MKKKNVRAKKARVDTPLEELNDKETLMHYNAVMMEEMNSKLQLVLEVVRSNSERLSTVENHLVGVENRLSTIELAFRGLKDDMLDMERRLSSKINRITERCGNHECRLTALEASQ